MNKRQTGSRWEDEAARFLTQCGLQIKEMNFRSRFGEIDIIAKDEEFFVFVEVKYRKTASFGNPEEAVDYKKAGKISKVADYYRVCRKIPADAKMRFDVVAIEGDDFKWYKNAFYYTA
jgi:putative endonuclease